MSHAPGQLRPLGMDTTTQQIGNKALFKRFHDAADSRDIDRISKVIDELVRPDAVVHTPLPIDATGPQLLKEVFTRLLRAFPDLHIHVDDLIEEGDKIVARNTVTGTHEGEYMGIPPTGTRVTYAEIFIFRFVGGQIAESWGVVDVMSQMRQLGVMPR